MGITEVLGNFNKGDLVNCIDMDGNEIATGLSNPNNKEIEAIKGLNTDDIESARLPYPKEVIHVIIWYCQCFNFFDSLDLVLEALFLVITFLPAIESRVFPAAAKASLAVSLSFASIALIQTLLLF